MVDDQGIEIIKLDGIEDDIEIAIETILNSSSNGATLLELQNHFNMNQDTIILYLEKEAQGKMADWNRHRGVGVTLLQNFVEERAVGEIIEIERKNMAKLNKFGHKDILIHEKGENTYCTTKCDEFRKYQVDPNFHHLGKRRVELEAKLLEKAIKDVQDPPKDCSAKEWKSTTHSDYGHEDLYGKISDLVNVPISDEELKKYSSVRTFWTDHAAQNHSTVYSSTPVEELHQLGKATNRPKFGKHSKFSTPIEQFCKSPLTPQSN
ncbi:hypothetical protein HK096_007849 [Nowakowskiella sp. JEL0078]|nr:hypothetical protein HK096_007849 [Nowakowskiella sp. JEL0078]